ncbi:MAG: class II fructose-bisphosphate aldolase [Erysipelotrichaceae bacterium]|nr:class II fructose-bisphosphate aldolase [Erysipelotrichaceae bacterium]
MLVTLTEILAEAKKGKYAVGAFNVPNLESLEATIAAAEELNVPVIIQHAEVHEDMIHLEEIGPIMVDAAKRAKVPVCVHYDHGATFDLCVKAIQLGFTGIMNDASTKPYEDNVRETAELVKIAHAVGVGVEAELGQMFNSSVGGGEGRSAVQLENFASEDDCYTNPLQAKDFVERTGVDCLAIAFGTSHGVYLTKPVLDLNRIAQIKEAIDIPFVMHGGSGVSDEDFKVAINNGICKINYYTYGAMAGAEAVRKMMEEKGDQKVFYHDIVAAGKEGIKENVKHAMEVFCSPIL